MKKFLLISISLVICIYLTNTSLNSKKYKDYNTYISVSKDSVNFCYEDNIDYVELRNSNKEKLKIQNSYFENTEDKNVIKIKKYKLYKNLESSKKFNDNFMFFIWICFSLLFCGLYLGAEFFLEILEIVLEIVFEVLFD